MLLNQSKALQQALAHATVKIKVGGQFKGSGFFITAAGHVLTAHHVIGEFPPPITVETFTGESFSAQVDAAHSLPEQDLAVLTVATVAPQWVPLGVISSQQVTDVVLSVGCPLGDRADNPHLGFYAGTIFRLRDDGKIETDAVRGQGQSGGLLYHEASQRVIAVAVEGYKPERMIAGLAQRLEGLFERWPELSALNQSAIIHWQQQFNHQSPQLLTSLSVHWRYGFIGLILLIILILIGILFSPGDRKTTGDCSPIADKVTGNVSIDCTIGNSPSK